MDWDTGSNKFFKSEAQAVSFALLDSKENLNARNRDCEEFEAGDDNENNDPQNCGKLNYASALWQPGSNGLFTINHERQKFSFVSTRNNNFSNRSQKFMVRVTGLQEWEVAVISISVVMAVLAPIGGFLFWAMYMKGMGFQESCLIYCCCCLGGVVGARSGKKKKKKKKKAMATSAADVTMDSNNQA